MTQRLFVYGTLAPGRPNEHVLSDISGTWANATVRGLLIQEGWGADQGYPGILLDEFAETVEGMLLTSDNLQCEWARLDDFEGSQYERVVARVQIEDGTIVDAFIYQLKK